MSLIEQLPKGMILLWYNNDTHLPKGWQLCNGQHGTPNLNERFVLGTTDFTLLGTQMGQASHFHKGITTGYNSGHAYDIDPNQHHPGTMAPDKDAALNIQTDIASNIPPCTRVIYIMKIE